MVLPKPVLLHVDIMSTSRELDFGLANWILEGLQNVLKVAGSHFGQNSSTFLFRLDFTLESKIEFFDRVGKGIQMPFWFRFHSIFGVWAKSPTIGTSRNQVEFFPKSIS